MNRMGHRLMLWAAWMLAPVMMLVALTAEAAVKREGAWPEADKKVTLDLDGAPRGAAVRKLATAAGWSLVIQSPLGADAGDLIDVHVKDQPAGKVLDLILDDGWIASRDGTLVSLRRGPAGASGDAAPNQTAPTPTASAEGDAEDAEPAAAAGIPPIPPIPSASAHRGKHGARGEDRVVTGGRLVIQKNEVVHDVSVFGGSLEVLGTVTGDISVTGGAIKIRNGAHVKGDVTGMGGSIDVEDGAVIEGDVGVVGGALHRGENAQIGGDVVHTGNGDDDDDEHAKADHPSGRERLGSAVRGVGSAITRAAFLFIFGAILLALGAQRMESMRGEVAARPMRTFAVGAVSVVVVPIALVLVCVTVIGIPVALVALMLAIFGGYAGVVAVLTTTGEALLRHKTQNTYLHLAAGCALFLVAGALPLVGHVVTFVVAVTGFGVFVATRAAGFWPEKKKPGAGPYRTAP